MDIIALIDKILLLFEKVSPALVELVKEIEPAAEQVQLRHRILYTKMYCRRKKFGKAQIEAEVSLEFKDFTLEYQQKISDLIVFELKK